MKNLTATCIIALSTFPALVNAQQISPRTTNGGDIGLQISDYKFEADRDGVFDKSREGKKIGLTGSFNQALENNWYWGGDARYASGNTVFTSATRGTNSANPESYLDMRITVGKDLEFWGNVLSPYTGFGHRTLTDDTSNYTDTGRIVYREKSVYLYVPIGLTHRFRLGSQSRFSTSVEYDYLLEGTQISYWTNIVGYTSDLYTTQRKGFGGRLSFAYETVTWSATLFYHYWNIQDSDLGNYTDSLLNIYSDITPHNITKEVGVQIKFRFN